MGRHAPKLYPVIEKDWYQAIPLKAACECFPVSYSTLVRWANEGKIAAWKPGAEWFVSVLSLIRLCGHPTNENLLLEKLPSIS